MPVDGPNGSAVYAEASVTGRKKEAVRECANEACKMLDAYGILRQSNHGMFGCDLRLVSLIPYNYDHIQDLKHFTCTCLSLYLFCNVLSYFTLVESRKKRERNWEDDDFYESDEDNFLDRTGMGKS